MTPRTLRRAARVLLALFVLAWAAPQAVACVHARPGPSVAADPGHGCCPSHRPLHQGDGEAPCADCCGGDCPALTPGHGVAGDHLALRPEPATDLQPGAPASRLSMALLRPRPPPPPGATPLPSRHLQPRDRSMVFLN